MKKKRTTRQIIRQIVREEVAMAIHEVVDELKQPNQQVVEQTTQSASPKKHFSKNSVLNDVLNETANGDNGWDTMGGTKFTSERMNKVVGSSFGDMMKDSPQQNVNLAASMGVDPNNAPDFLTKDYRKVMKAIDKKRG